MKKTILAFAPALLVPALAYAAPITLQFEVNINERCMLAAGGSCSAVSITQLLTLTYDDAVTGHSLSDDGISTAFGPLTMTLSGTGLDWIPNPYSHSSNRDWTEAGSSDDGTTASHFVVAREIDNASTTDAPHGPSGMAAWSCISSNTRPRMAHQMN